MSFHLTQQYAKKRVGEPVTETRLLLDIVYANLQPSSYKSLQWDAVAHTHTQQYYLLLPLFRYWLAIQNSVATRDTGRQIQPERP